MISILKYVWLSIGILYFTFEMILIVTYSMEGPGLKMWVLDNWSHVVVMCMCFSLGVICNKMIERK